MVRHTKKRAIQYEPVSVIMPVMNNLEFTKDCVESIYKYTEHPFEFIIIDNASTDGTPEYLSQLAKKHNNVRIITMEKNIGVAPSWNLGVREAKHDYVAIINNDIIILTPHWLYEMETILKSSSDIYWTSPTTCYTLDMSKISYKASHYEQLLYGKSNTQYVVACCFMCPKSIFETDSIGPFDENFEYKYYEDLDYIARIWESGHKVKMASRVKVYHAVGRTSRKTAGGENNENYYQKKWGGGPYDILSMQPSRDKKSIKHIK